MKVGSMAKKKSMNTLHQLRIRRKSQYVDFAKLSQLSGKNIGPIGEFYSFTLI